FGGRNDAAGAQSLARSIGESATALAGGLSLYECASVLKRCALALGNDTGLMHLARAVGIKTGVVFGATTSAWGFFPRSGPASKIFERPLWCRPCHAHGGTLCFRGGRPCLRRVTPQSVIAGLEELLNNSPA
ncbi:MAG: glycosyltransferase family 9 protein, partial [Chitinivibrionales bacterium]|nr:glycosyltransferase family 9 protein [Chitinivibrionales bacterium]